MRALTALTLIAIGGCSGDSEAGAPSTADASAPSTVDEDADRGATDSGSGTSRDSMRPSAGGTGGTAPDGGRDAGTAGEGAKADAGEALEPPPGEYGERAALLEANSEMAVAEAGGKIYVLGGYPANREVQTTVQVYDPQTDSWDRAMPLPIALHHPVVVGVGDKLYSLGGQLVTGDTDRTLVYDPATNGPWQDLAPMPTPRGAGAAAVIGDMIYVVGGRPPAGNAFEVYDIREDRWARLPDLPQRYPNRNHLAAAAIGGKVYVAGGRHSGGSFRDPLTDSLDIYDPETREWSDGAAMLRPRGGVNGIAAYGCFYVWGGEGANIQEPNDVFPDHDVYNPVTDHWMALPALPVPIHGVTGAAFLNGLIYMPGGGTRQGGTSGSTIFQVFRPNLRCDG